MNKSLELLNFPYIKEKSWVARVVEGKLIDGEVRAEQCQDCRSSCDLIAFYKGDSNSLLYGCTNSKCKHILIHVKFNPTTS